MVGRCGGYNGLKQCLVPADKCEVMAVESRERLSHVGTVCVSMLVVATVLVMFTAPGAPWK